MNGVLNKRYLFKEMEESIVCVTHVMRIIRARSPEEAALVVVDVCSGKGIASMLLSSILCEEAAASREETSTGCLQAHRPRLVAADLSSGHDAVKLDHFEAMQEHYDAGGDACWPVEFKVVDVHKPVFPQFLKSFDAPFLLFGIHLCRHLSSRIVELTNTNTVVEALVLMPCCLPIAASPVFCIRAGATPPCDCPEKPRESASTGQAAAVGSAAVGCEAPWDVKRPGLSSSEAPPGRIISPKALHASPNPFRMWIEELKAALTLPQKWHWTEIPFSGSAAGHGGRGAAKIVKKTQEDHDGPGTFWSSQIGTAAIVAVRDAARLGLQHTEWPSSE
jgi:hypothetical protein